MTRRRLIELIEGSAFFDEAAYLSQHPDVALSGLSAAEHYLTIGARLGRDPGPEFDGAAYLATYLDVTARGENPLAHFEQHGRGEGRSPAPVPPRAPSRKRPERRVDVIVPVFNALEDVRACLSSISACETGYSVRVLVVNDGSRSDTTEFLHSACAKLPNEKTAFSLLDHGENRGYTKAVNTGLRASDAPYVVLLNSDTIVTPFWLDGLVQCLESDPALGIVGPLSNAASWQNVPELFAPEGGFAINALPEGITPALMADIVRSTSRRTYPRSPFVNGFCFMIRRAVIEAIGLMDEVAFPTGYGEENDYCVRALDAGFALAYADDTYVFHAKSKSFGSERREALSKAGAAAIREKHGADKFEALLDRVKLTGMMDHVRERVRDRLDHLTRPISARAGDYVSTQKVLFLLPVQGGGGGAHSVVQEALAMREMGIDVKIAVHDADFYNFMHLYADIDTPETLFTGFREETIVGTAQSFDVVVATIYSSVRLLERVVAACPWILPAYYAQDYEPFFFDRGSDRWIEAFESYTRVPGAVVMAKTHWICRQIADRHGIEVCKVEPSIDHAVYYPGNAAKPAGHFTISAMIRPSTPRRGAKRTMELLARLKQSFGERVDLHIFGCRDDEDSFKALSRDFDFRNHGVLTRRQVADLLRQSDLFLDLSDYQAFGRTGLEAMACGTVPLVPREGGAEEYAIDTINALIADTFNTDECYARLHALLAVPEQLARMRLEALQTATRYSRRRAAMSELVAFAQALAQRRGVHAKPVRPKVVLLPALTGSGSITITGSGYVRLLCPYRQDLLTTDWDIDVLHDGSLPAPGTADILVLQRDLMPGTRAEFAQWHTGWRQAGGRLVYEIDDDLTDPIALVERGYSGDAEALRARVLAYAEAADTITVSTGKLASVLSDYSDKIKIVPNYIDARLWNLTGADTKPGDTEPPAQKKRLKIGYAGTPTHTEDLALVAPVLRSLQERYDIDIDVIGAFQNTEPLFGKRIGLPRNSVYPVFTEWLRRMADWDIGIIPLVDSPFNQSKSYLKFIEYAALDTAIVCSENPEYRQVARHDQNCLLVNNDPASWDAALVRLIENGALRQKLAGAARREVQEKWTVQSHAGLYHAALQSALSAI